MSVLDALANEGEPLPIGGPLRKGVAKALGGVGDLADMASVGVHREDCGVGLIGIEVAAKGDLTVGSSTTAGRALLFSTTATQRRNNDDEEEQHYDDPQTPGEDRVSAPPALLRGLLLRCLLLRCLL